MEMEARTAYRQRAAGKSDGMERVEVGGHAAEWNGHAVVIEVLRVVGGQVGEQELVDAAIAEDGVMQARAVAEADGEAWGISWRSWRRR